MSFLFVSTEPSFDAERLIHHPKGVYVHEHFLGVWIHIQTREKQECIAKRGDCMVVVMGTIDQCTPQQLLSRYLLEGIDVSSSLFGSFIAIIVHGERIFVIRDPIGVRTVYYREGQEGHVTICTDPVALSDIEQREDAYLRDMFFHSGHILFGIQHWGRMMQLRPGYWMSKFKNHMAQQVCYYQLPTHREKNDFSRRLYAKTLSRVLHDTAHVKHMIPQQNVQTLVLLQVLKAQKRTVVLHGIEDEEWVERLAKQFSMPVQYIEPAASIWETMRATRWYGGAPPPDALMLRMYTLSSFLQDKDVYIPVEESFGGAWLQRFLLLLHYFSPQRGEAYLRACMGAGEWSQDPKALRFRARIAKRLEEEFSAQGQDVVDGAIRMRVQQWGGMILLPVLRALFPHVHVPLFDERLVRLSFSMPRQYLVQQGKAQSWFWDAYIKGIDKELVELFRNYSAPKIVFDDECRMKARKKIERAPIHEELRDTLLHRDDAHVDRILWFIAQY